MQGNTMLGAGGNNPMVQGDITAKTGAIINLGTQVINTAGNINLGTEEYQVVAGQVVKHTAIAFIVQGALDATKFCLQISVGLFRGAKTRLKKIEDSLVEIRDFIVIAERSPIKDPKLMELLEKLKDAAYDAEDLLEEYAIEDRRRSEEAANSMSVRDTMTNRAHKVVTSVLVSPIIMRKKLKDLSERLEAIKAECHTFQLKKKVTDLEIECKEQRETYSVVTKSRVIGRDEEEKEIVTLLLSTELDDGSVIAIVGIGGLGKTTLAQSVFNHDEVQNHFQPKMWICVSDNLEPDNFDIKRLGNKILGRETPDRHNLSDLEDLWCRVREALGGKRFLLVLDDVWNEKPENWYRLTDLLLCGGRGSRIVITTRTAKVASNMSEIHLHNLKPLSEDACWSLFCQRAFGNQREEAAHPNLAAIGREIVKKCRGIPLAVTTLGGLLYDKRSESRWKSVRDSEMWSLPEETVNGILPALRLSYNYLKPHTKQCFAFCAIFPQDYKIGKELVIQLWMAQGFIPTDQKGSMELEDIGKEIYDELVMRSFFFEDVEKHDFIPCGPFFYGERITFQMHDLMHDLAHSVMENEYCFVHNGMSKDISPRIRHVSSSRGYGILPASLPKAQMLRTYVLLRGDNFQFPCDVGLFKCLRALDFNATHDEHKVEKQLFTSLGNLQHLRYLDLSSTSIKMLPESLTSLCFLQTLMLTFCPNLCELPKGMSKLTNLRYLYINECYKLTHMPPKMGELSCLQVLSNFIVGTTDEIACSGLRELQGLNLRGRLQINLLKNVTDAIDVPSYTLINKPNLTSLALLWENQHFLNVDLEKDRDIYREIDREIEVLEEQVLHNLQPHRNLKELGIYHYGGLSFPSWMMDTTLTKLVEITLSECWRCNHLPPLGELHFLKVLRIFHLKNVECIGNEFYGNEVSGGFPSLTELYISGMEKLKTWSGLEWKGKRAFPSLAKLKFGNCPMLSTLNFFPDIKDVNVDQGMMQSLKNQKSLEPMHQQNCNQSSFADEDQIRSQSSLQQLEIQYCKQLIFSGLGLRYLTSLKTLKISGSNEFVHVAHELSFLTSLQTLHLHSFHGLKSLPEGIENLTSLQSLSIQNCPEIASLPRELQHLSALERLTIYNCHPSLKIRYTKDTGEDWDKIQHIPHIFIEGKTYL